MLRRVSRSISEIAAVSFALFLFFFLYRGFWRAPADPAAAISHTYWFCAICAFYWWLQSGTLAFAGVRSAWSMAADILISIVPLFVVGYFLIDLWRGNDQVLANLTNFKTNGAYFALVIILLDVTFNVLIMARVSRFWGENGGNGGG